uniref:Putative ribonuclease H-like domain-containing protein n=1 Tax=Tanacetum cinerariifolium TaxID=118510 RepID=A0A6L2KT68_TANCI|nr:putative ribonuclease H-like domain-containing protein [Tanacetum cinerariifolium]
MFSFNLILRASASLGNDLASEDETTGILKRFMTEIENLVDKKVKVIRCDNGTEFKNSVMNDFCAMKGIIREFSVARTLQQNGVVERRNRTLIKAARTMLADSKLPTTFWAKAVNTTCYVHNKMDVKSAFLYERIEEEVLRKFNFSDVKSASTPVDMEKTLVKDGMIADLDAYEGVALVDETQGRSDQDMFDTSIFDDEEVAAKKEVSTAEVVPTVSEVVITAGVEVTTKERLAIAFSRFILTNNHLSFTTPTPIDSSQQPSKAKEKGKAKMIEPEKPLKRKDQIMIDEEVARNIEAQMQAELEKKRGLLNKSKKKTT